MKKINIEITNAKILSYSVELNDEYPSVSATIGLFAGEKQISTFSLRTENYYSNSVHFDLPTSLINPIKEISIKLEEILIRECNKDFLQIESPK